MVKQTCSECQRRRKCAVSAKLPGGIPVWVCGVCWHRFEYDKSVSSWRAAL